MSSKRGGKGNSRAGGSGGLPREVQVSKKMSWLLRHNAEKQGLKLGPGGYVNAKDALNTNALKGLHVTFEEMKQVVVDNEKQRFSLIPRTTVQENDDTEIAQTEHDLSNTAAELPADFDQTDPANYLIRANQGHSIKVDDEGLLTPITLADAANLPTTVVHGTTYQAWPLILRSGGLKRMSRNHIHFASGLPPGFVPLEGADGAEEEASATSQAKKDPVISGMRNTSTILIYVDLPAALEAGIKFGKSENGVILTEGDENGVVASKFFRRVEERKGGYGILMENGEVLKELPKHIPFGNGRGRGR